MESSSFQSLMDWLVQHPNLSGLVIFSIAAIESMVVIGVLVPGVAIMIGIGALVGLDVLPLWPTLLWAAAGAIFGDGIGYWLGRHYDRQLRNIWPLTRYPDLIPRGERFFKRHGGKSILFGRFVGPVRSVIPVVAGMMHMHPGYFYLVNIASAIAWAPVVILPGVAFGASLNLATEVALRFAALLVIAFLLMWFIAWLLRKLLGSTFSETWSLIWPALKNQYRQRPLVLAGSFSITLILTLSLLIVIMSNGPIRHYQSPDDKWWDSGWRSLPVFLNDKNHAPPFTLQWRGELNEIKSHLSGQGWIEPDVLTLKNAMRWLTPNPVLVELPVRQKEFNGKKTQLLMAKGLPQQSGAMVLYMWALPLQDRTDEQEQYWLGLLATVDMVELIAGFHIPQSNNISAFNLKKTAKAWFESERVSGFDYKIIDDKNDEPFVINDKSLPLILIKRADDKRIYP